MPTHRPKQRREVSVCGVCACGGLKSANTCMCKNKRAKKEREGGGGGGREKTIVDNERHNDHF